MDDDIAAISGATCWSIGHSFVWAPISKYFEGWICWRCGALEPDQFEPREEGI
jgi:hypothetical protein